MYFQSRRRTTRNFVDSEQRGIGGGMEFKLTATRNARKRGLLAKSLTMCNFHALGRKDINVRMLIRAGTKTKGRPFCVQNMDALQATSSTKELQDNGNGNGNGKGNNKEEWEQPSRQFPQYCISRQPGLYIARAVLAWPKSHWRRNLFGFPPGTWYPRMPFRIYRLKANTDAIVGPDRSCCHWKQQRQQQQQMMQMLL